MPSKEERVLDLLEAAMPSPAEMTSLSDRIGDLDTLSVRMYEKGSVPPSIMALEIAEQSQGMGNTTNALAVAQTHPVLMARYMLALALLACIIRRQSLTDEDACDPWVLKNRLFDAIREHVTSDPGWAPSVELMQGGVLEVALLRTHGSFRAAFKRIRKIMQLALKSNLHVPNSDLTHLVLDSRTRFDASFLWQTILNEDRQIALLIGHNIQLSEDVSMSQGDPIAAGESTISYLQLESKIISQIMTRDLVGDAASFRDARIQYFDLQMAQTAHDDEDIAVLEDSGKFASRSAGYTLLYITAKASRQFVLMRVLLPFAYLPSRQLGNGLGALDVAMTQAHFKSLSFCVGAMRNVVFSSIQALRHRNGLHPGRDLSYMAITAASLLILAHAETNIIPRLIGIGSLRNKFLDDWAAVQELSRIEEIVHADPTINPSEECGKALDQLKKLLTLDMPRPEHVNSGMVANRPCRLIRIAPEAMLDAGVPECTLELVILGTVRVARKI